MKVVQGTHHVQYIIYLRSFKAQNDAQNQYSIQVLQVNTLYKYYKSILYTSITSQYSIQVLQVRYV
jgi:hypothetical protein